jgi:hypothetical protein
MVWKQVELGNIVMSKQELNDKLLEFFTVKDEYSKEAYSQVNKEVWTLADLLVRQWLNNGGDGFEMVNVYEGYEFVKEHKQELIDNNMLSKEGFNNAGFRIWDNYEI